MPELAAVKRGFLKNVTSSIGCSTRDSHQANEPSATAATANAVSVCDEAQPAPGASMIAQTSVMSPTIESNAPTTSSLALVGSFDVGIKKNPVSNANATIGIFTRKIDPQ